nr:hypothetical protein [Tanacetum cinerariifolium]
ILFSTIKVVSRHKNTQQYGVILPIELTTEDIRNTKAYKEYYVCATGEAAPKPKASARRKRGGSDSSTTPPTPIATPTPITTVVAAPRLTAAAKRKQPARTTSPTNPLEVERIKAEQLKIVLRRSRQETHISQHSGFSTDEGTGSKLGVPNVPFDDSEEEISWNSSDDEDVDAQDKDRDDDEGKKNDESDDRKDYDDDDNDDEEEITKINEPKDTESGRDDEETKSDGESEEEETKEEEKESFDPIPRTPEDSEDDGNGKEDQGLRISVEERIHEEEEADELYHDEMTEAVREAVQIQTDRLQDSLQRENDEFLRTIDDNIKKIIKEQVKIDLSEMELKKILIDKMEGNKSIQRSDEQRNLYKALVEAYEADKTILDSYGESAILKRIHEDDDDQEGPSAGSDKGSKRRREGREHALASTPSKPVTGSAGRSTTRTQSRQISASESAFAKEPMQTTCQMDEPSHPVFETGAEDQPIVQTSQHPEWFSQPRKPPTPDHDWNKTLRAVQGSAQLWISELEKQADARSLFNKLLDTPLDFFNFIMNWLDVDTLTPELLAGPTYELIRGSCNSLTELEYHLEEVYKATTDQLDWEPLNYDKHARWGVSHWGQKRQQFYGFAVNRESALDVYSKRRIIAITDLKIVEWHNYKHLDWISQFWYSIKKVQGTDSYEFLLANKKCVVNVDVFRTIFVICPKVEGVNFTNVPDDDTTLAFLIKLGYKGPLYKHTNMFVDHMHQPWRTLAAIINKCLSRKTASNDKLRKSRIDILWGMFYIENVDYPELIWEDLAYRIDHIKEKRSRIGEDYQEYGLLIPKTMLIEAIKQSESYQMFIKYSTESKPKPKPVKRKTSSKRRVKKRVTLSVDDNIIFKDPDIALELGNVTPSF